MRFIDIDLTQPVNALVLDHHLTSYIIFPESESDRHKYVECRKGSIDHGISDESPDTKQSQIKELLKPTLSDSNELMAGLLIDEPRFEAKCHKNNKHAHMVGVLLRYLLRLDKHHGDHRSGASLSKAAHMTAMLNGSLSLNSEVDLTINANPESIKALVSKYINGAHLAAASQHILSGQRTFAPSLDDPLHSPKIANSELWSDPEVRTSYFERIFLWLSVSRRYQDLLIQFFNDHSSNQSLQDSIWGIDDKFLPHFSDRNGQYRPFEVDIDLPAFDETELKALKSYKRKSRD